MTWLCSVSFEAIMPRKCFWLDTCLVPLSLKHLRYQGCAKLLLMFFFSTCLCFESVTSLFPSYFLLFSCCSFIFFLEETIKQQFQPILMFPCPINICGVFAVFTPQVSWCKPTAWTINAMATWQTKKVGPRNHQLWIWWSCRGAGYNPTHLPKRPFIGAQLYFI